MFVVAKRSPISASAEHLLQSSRQSVPIFYSGSPLPHKIAICNEVSESPCNTRFPCSSRVHDPNGISDGSAVFVEFTTRSPFSHNNCPFRRGSGPLYLTGGSLGPPEPRVKRHLDRFIRFLATVWKTVCPMLSDRCFPPVLPVRLSVLFVTVGWITMKLGMHVGLGPGHIVLDGDLVLLPQRGTAAPIFGPYLLLPNDWID